MNKPLALCIKASDDSMCIFEKCPYYIECWSIKEKQEVKK
jgi:hypothetical protein